MTIHFPCRPHTLWRCYQNHAAAKKVTPLDQPEFDALLDKRWPGWGMIYHQFGSGEVMNIDKITYLHCQNDEDDRLADMCDEERILTHEGQTVLFDTIIEEQLAT